MALGTQSLGEGLAGSGLATQSRADARWLVGPLVDSVAVLGGAALVSLALYTSARAGAALALAGALFAMITDMPHVVQTTVRIGLDPVERALHGRRYLISLTAITLLTFAMFASGNRPVVAMIWIVWQVLHVIKQHYGITRIYAVKAQYRGPYRWMAAVLVLGCATPVLYRLGQGMHFNEYVVFGERLSFSGLGLPNIPVPRALIVAMYCAFACVLFLFVSEQRARQRAGAAVLPPIVHATLLLAIVSYNLSYLFVSDLYALILIATTVHSFQYHAICWRRNYGRFARDPAAPGKPLLLGMLSQKKNLWAYAALVVVTGAALANTDTLWFGFIPFVLVLHHFYMDGYIWRSSLNPTLAADLGIARTRVAGAAGAV
jgi:hypothetical protein